MKYILVPIGRVFHFLTRPVSFTMVYLLVLLWSFQHDIAVEEASWATDNKVLSFVILLVGSVLLFEIGVIARLVLQHAAK